MTGLFKDLWRGSKRRLEELATDENARILNWRSPVTKSATVVLVIAAATHEQVCSGLGLWSVVFYSTLVYLILKTPKTPKIF